MELFVFSQDEQLLTIISEDTGLVEALYRIEVNSIPTEPFSFTVESDQKVAEHVKEENKVMFKDHEGDWRLMNIKEVDDSNDIDGPVTIATCEPAFLAELNEHIVVDRQFVNQTADVVLAAAVEGTRWQASVEVELGRATVSFYYISSMEAIWETIETWGGEFKDIVNFDETTNKITGCYVKILQRLGAENGQRFEIDHNTTEIGRTVLSYPKTALYGQGASLKTENDDSTRYIDFGDVEWRANRGDPVDKPLGQKWVGDPDALDKYGILEEGKKRHRDGTYSNQDYEEPSELLYATWESLQKAKKPEVNYRLSVELFNEKVNLGDTCQAIDRKFARPIEIQARVIAMEYDLMDIEGTMVVEMGQFLDLGADRITDLEKEVENIKNRPPKSKIDEESYPNIKPDTPINLEAEGGFQVVQLYWDYDEHLYISHYEVFGSRTEDFVPDTQHLLWKGRVSGFSHDVGTDEVWYYRVRAVNYHGTPSEWSVQVRAATYRVISDDILFGEDIAEELRELSKEAKILAEGSVSKEELEKAITDDIDTAKNQANEAVANANIAKSNALEAISEAQEAFDKVQLAMTRADSAFTKAEALSEIVENNTGEISTVKQIAQGLQTRVSNTEGDVSTLQQTANSFGTRIGNAESNISSLTLTAQGLQTTVRSVRDDLDGLEIGGRNLWKFTDYKTIDIETILDNYEFSGNGNTPYIRAANWDSLEGTSVYGEKVLTFTARIGGVSNQYYFNPVENGNRYIKLTPNTDYVFSADYYHGAGVKNINFTVWGYDNDGGNRVRLTAETFSTTFSPQFKRFEFRFRTDDRMYYETRIYIAVDKEQDADTTAYFHIYQPQLEQGNKVSQYSPAFEDMATQSQITQLSDVISSKITKGQADGWYASQSQLTQTASSLQSTIKGVKDNLSTVDRNLIMNSKGDTLEGWHPWGGTANVSVADYIGYTWIWARQPASTNAMGVNTPVFSMKANKTYICSFIIRSRSNSGYDLNYLYLRQGDNTITSVKSLPTVNMRTGFDGDISGNGLRVWFTFSHDEDIADARLLLAIRNRTEGSGFVIREIKVSEGDILTTWSHAPEETATQSQFSQLSDSINLRVMKNDVVNQINVDTSGVLIAGNKVRITGQTTIDNGAIKNAAIANAAITSAKIASAAVGTAAIANAAITKVKLGTAVVGTAQIENGAVTNAKIGNATIDTAKIANSSITDAKIASLRADKISGGTVDANNVTVKVKNGVQEIQLNDKGIEAIDSRGNVRIHLGVRNIAGKGQSDPSTIRFFSGNGSTSAGVGMNVNGHFIIGSQSNGVSTSIYSDSNQLYYAQQHRFVMGGVTRPDEYIQFTSIENTSGTRREPYIRTPYTASGYIGSANYTWWRIYASNIHESSTIERKTSISNCDTHLSYKVLKGMEIKQYRSKTSEGNPTGEWKFGVISEYAPKEILDISGKAVSLYSMISHTANVVKDHTSRLLQLDEENNEIRKENEKLVFKVADLEKRLHKLEGSA